MSSGTIEIAQSTPTAAAIAALVQTHYGLGAVVESEFLRRSFNQVNRLNFLSGQRAVARLCTDRPRGKSNLLFEAAALEHLAECGCPVPRCLPAANDDVAIDVRLPEGNRSLILFEYLDGEETGDSPEEIKAFAHGLAALHTAGESYRGTPSAYTLNLEHLLHRLLQRLLQAATMTAVLRTQFAILGKRLNDRIVSLGKLQEVLCHGDAHGKNNFVVRRSDGRCEAQFFDFDEARPGILAYELAVYPWNLHPRTPDGEFSEAQSKQCLNFINAYKEVRPIPDVDLAAISPFMAVRQFWLMGEYAGRTPVWGSQTMPTAALSRQLEMLRSWETLKQPHWGGQGEVSLW
jgi:Ser/Thr protein kinase RdoA (MazF antagonist)